MICSNRSRVSSNTAVRSKALTVANLGSSDRSDISPKKSPSPRKATMRRLPDFRVLTTSTLPSTMANRELPGCPSSTIVSPGWKTRGSRASSTDRSSRSPSPESRESRGDVAGSRFTGIGTAGPGGPSGSTCRASSSASSRRAGPCFGSSRRMTLHSAMARAPQPFRAQTSASASYSESSAPAS